MQDIGVKQVDVDFKHLKFFFLRRHLNALKAELISAHYMH
jgi:hypothetical protein